MFLGSELKSPIMVVIPLAFFGNFPKPPLYKLQEMIHQIIETTDLE